MSTRSRPRRATAFAVAVGRDTARALRGHDLLLYAAGLTFYAALGLVPLLLLATKASSLLLGQDAVLSIARRFGSYAGDRLGLDTAVQTLAAAGIRANLAALVAAAVPASLYSEGFVRAFDRLSARGVRRNRTARGRLFAPLLIGAITLGLVGGLSLGGLVADALPAGGGSEVLGIYLAFCVLWVLGTALLALLYRVFSTERPGARALLLGAAATGSWQAGMSLGFLLVIRLATGVGTPYAGSRTLGDAAALCFLLYLTHIVVLGGFTLTLRIDSRLRPVLLADTVAPWPSMSPSATAPI